MNFIPVDKRTKKQQKEFNSKQRLMWDRSPMSETFKNKKAFNKADRNKSKVSVKRGDFQYV